MQQSNAKSVIIENSTALETVRRQQRKGNHYAAYIGMDVHKDTITYAVALPGRASADYRGEITHTPKAVNKLIERLSPQYSQSGSGHNLAETPISSNWQDLQESIRVTFYSAKIHICATIEQWCDPVVATQVTTRSRTMEIKHEK